VWGPRRNRLALRHGSWKIVRLAPTAPWELYHLGDDPYEKTNLAAKLPEKLAELQALFNAEKSKDAL
jgi:arylsulfatase A-like enzyme